MEKKKPYSAPDVEPLALDDDALDAASGGSGRDGGDEYANSLMHRTTRNFSDRIGCTNIGPTYNSHYHCCYSDEDSGSGLDPGY